MGPTDGSGARDQEADLVRRVQAGDREAYAGLVARHMRRVYAVAAAFLDEPADAEDLTQEAFLRALEAVHTFDARRPFGPWIYQIVRNVARNKLKRRSRWRTREVSPTLVAKGQDPAAELEAAEIREHVLLAVEELREKQRIAFWLHDVEGFDSEEIAALLGVSAGTVRSHLHHARRALRDALGVHRSPKAPDER